MTDDDLDDRWHEAWVLNHEVDDEDNSVHTPDPVWKDGYRPS